jgi:hypothetical protein
VDYHLILDLLPHLAATYLSGRLPATLSYGQAAILLTLGLQQQELEVVEGALGLPGSQVGEGGGREGGRGGEEAGGFLGLPGSQVGGKGLGGLGGGPARGCLGVRRGGQEGGKEEAP